MYSTLDGLSRLPRIFAVVSFKMSTIAGRPLPKLLELEAKPVIRVRDGEGKEGLILGHGQARLPFDFSGVIRPSRRTESRDVTETG